MCILAKIQSAWASSDLLELSLNQLYLMEMSSKSKCLLLNFGEGTKKEVICFTSME